MLLFLLGLLCGAGSILAIDNSDLHMISHSFTYEYSSSKDGFTHTQIEIIVLPSITAEVYSSEEFEEKL